MRERKALPEAFAASWERVESRCMSRRQEVLRVWGCSARPLSAKRESL